MKNTGRIETRTGAPEEISGNQEERERLLEACVLAEPEILTELGKGNSSKVFLAREPHTKKLLAVKIINTASELGKKSAEKELRFAKKLLKHPNVIEIHKNTFEKDCAILYLEYFPGEELLYFIQRHRKLDAAVSEEIFSQIVSAVSYLHENRVCHLDIKPENILINARLQVKLIDFGMSQIAVKNGLVESYGGSLQYASPEALTGGVFNGFLADSWSCGVVLFVMIHGRFPPPTPCIEDIDTSDNGKREKTETRTEDTPEKPSAADSTRSYPKNRSTDGATSSMPHLPIHANLDCSTGHHSHPPRVPGAQHNLSNSPSDVIITSTQSANRSYLQHASLLRLNRSLRKLLQNNPGKRTAVSELKEARKTN